jgi:hypothetical protein
VYFNPLVIKLKNLELGIKLEINQIISDVKFFLIAGVFDKPAKSAILNMISSIGFYGCTKCLQPGISLKALNNDGEETGKKYYSAFLSHLFVAFFNLLTNFIGGHQHIYPFNEQDPAGPKRTDIAYSNDLKQVKKSSDPIHGIKGPCCLASLKYFNPISSTCIDYMHSVLEGVIKKFFEFWFDSKYSLEEFSLRKMQQEIEKRLMQIKPPHFVPSTPRSVYSHNLWRAHEYLTFILYYALPVFKDMLPFEYYEHLKKLVLIIETLLAPEINVPNLKEVNKIVIEFVKDASQIYPEIVMLSGMHELLHLVECTLHFGPLNVINCFQFEELNRKLMRFLHGYDLIGEEIIKVFSTAQILSLYTENITNYKLKKYVLSRLNFKSSNIKRLIKNKNGIEILDKFTLINEVRVLNAYEKFSGRTIQQLNVFKRIKLDGIVFNSNKNITKWCDSCFKTNKNEIGLIDYFFIENEKVFCVSNKIVRLMNSIYLKDHLSIKSNLYLSYISDELFITEVRDIKKLFLIDINKNNCFVSLFSSSHLFS